MVPSAAIPANPSAVLILSAFFIIVSRTFVSFQQCRLVIDGTMIRLSIPSAACAALLAISAPLSPVAAQPGDESAAWRDVATERDRARIRGWRAAWMDALAQARRTDAAQVQAAGALLEPDAALPNPAPPPGAYRCRTIKLGSQGGGGLGWIDYPWFSCRIAQSGGALAFTRMGGSQRPIGRIYPADPRRMIFLGSLQLGDERRVLRYGADADRDMAGLVERVGEDRWRLVVPRPTFESIVDVIELIPAT